MTLEVYNSLSRQKETFIPVEKEKMKMYVCGMTVYSDAHIGHARTYLAFDLIRRYFEYKKYAVTYVQNITDVDDKIIAAANKQHIDPLKYSDQFGQRCLEDLDRLGIRRADAYPKASETIPGMITMITQLIDKGAAYEAEGDVYFSVSSFPGYGKLSGVNIEEMKAGARVEPEGKKHNGLDFALWKQAKPGEPFWESPWGKGRPGWHIECSVMSSTLLGLPFDIHGGGIDLRFPHHENEIAQAEAATDKPFAKYWMHIGLLTIGGEKMSKSLGNMINIRDLLKHWDAEVIRMFFAQAHYRSPPDFTEKALGDVQKGLERIYRVKEKLEVFSQNIPQDSFPDTLPLTVEEQKYKEAVDLFQKEFETAMDDDFNTPKAFATLFEFVNTSNRFFETNIQPMPEVCGYALGMLTKLGHVLTLFQEQKDKQQETDPQVITALQQVLKKLHKPADATSLESLLEELLTLRETARKNKEWNTADTIRNTLGELGFEIQDTAQGPVWRRK